METNKSWKSYNDEWNIQNYQLDQNNKLKYFSLCNISPNINNEVVASNKDEHLQTDGKNKLQYYEIISFDTMKNILKINNFKTNNINDLVIMDYIIKIIGWCSTNTNNIDELHRNDEITVNFIEAIKWICNAIEYFMVELKIPKITNKQYNGLIRSSYKLCPNKASCIYQYPDNNIHNTCKFQHFPYDNLFLDCNSILDYISEQFNQSAPASKTSRLIMALSNRSKQTDDSENNTGKTSSNELKRCLTTLNFVFMIMFRELETIDKIRKSEPNYNIRKYHSYHTLFKYDNRVEYGNSNFKHKTPSRGSSYGKSLNYRNS